MDRTPSSPIVVEAQAVRPSPAPTVRIPIAPLARTVQVSLTSDAGTAPGASRRLDSVISGGFFQEGERQEANGWEDSPLALDPSPEDAPPAFSSFDRIPRKRGPLVVTTFILGIALVIGFAVKGIGTGTARAWMASSSGQRAVDVLNKAKAGLTTGLAIHLTPESTAAATRAMVPQQQPAPTPAVAAPVAQPVAVAAAMAPSTSTNLAVTAPSPEARPRRSVALVPRPAPAVAHRAEQRPVAAPTAAADRPSDSPIAPATIEKEEVAIAAPSEVKAMDVPERRVPETAHRGMVWSPSEQRLVPAQAADSPPADTVRPSANADKPATDGDKTVLPLDDDAHSTF